MRKIFWISFLFFLPFLSEGYQISGYISLKWRGVNTYKATIVDYTVGNPNLDSVNINWGDGDTSWIHRSNGNGATVCDSLLMSTYTWVHTFPGDGTYNIWMDGGGRVANIINMTNSAGQDFVLFHSITISALLVNDSIISPIIVNAPVCSYGIVGNCYYFNLGAYSPQNDSLSYSLGNCDFANGYYLPPNVTLNSITDSLIWCSPTLPGLYNFSILITTYRRVIIGGHPHQIPADTTEVELQVLIRPKTLGIEELNPNSRPVKLFPNPNNGSFTISLQGVSEKTQIVIYNMLGERVYESTLNATNTQIDLNDKAAGIYLYRVVTESGELISEGKFIIQK